MQEKYSNIFLSILWGISIALLFKIMCKNGECVVIKKPFNKNKLFTTSNYCYKLKKVSC
jgi:hypothetical protein